MPEAAEQIVESAITETQESTGTISGKEFGDQVEKRVQDTTNQLREQFGEAADELVGNVTSTVTGYRAQLTEMIGDNNVGDTEEIGAAGFVVRDTKETVLSKRGTDLHVDDEGYRRRVRAHEEVHRDGQATSYNSQTVRAIDDTGKFVEVSVVGDLTEGHAIRESSQPDSDLVPGYIEHRKQEQKLARVVGENRINEALASGDTASLQQEIIEKQREQILMHVLDGQSLPGEQN